jgi:polyvinyl alcohol dehydrogenase (cytochrome)
LLTTHALGAPPISPADWPQYNHDNRGWRFNAAEKTLSPANAGKLVERWRFPSRGSGKTIGAVHATPVVVNGFTYAGTARPGVLFKLSPQGEEVWRFEVPRSKHDLTFKDANGVTMQFGEAGLMGWTFTNSPLVTGDSVFFTTGDGQIYCLDRFSGKKRWSMETRTDPFPGNHKLNSFWSSPIMAEGKLIVGGGALEQGAASLSTDYPCCTGRGFLVALDPGNGTLLWKYDLGPVPEKFDPPLVADRSGVKVTYTHGPSTSTAWSTPSYDPETHLLFFGTDTNNSPRRATPDDARQYTEHSCAIIAIDVRDGRREKWISQLVKNDVWHVGVPGWDPKTGQYKDVSIGDTPKVYDITWKGQPRKALGVGCKNGGYYLLDRLTGEILHHTTLYAGPPEPEQIADRASGILAMPSMIGGLQTGCAFDGQRAYTNGIDWQGIVKQSLNKSWNQYPPSGGRVCAISPNAFHEFWRHERPQVILPRLDNPQRNLLSGDPVGSGIAVANGVAYFTTTISRKLVAVDTASGSLLVELPLEPVWCGPAVSRGRVYVGVGAIIWEPWTPDPEEVKQTFVFSFPVEANGAVYSFGLPGQDEVDRLPAAEGP